MAKRKKKTKRKASGKHSLTLFKDRKKKKSKQNKQSLFVLLKVLALVAVVSVGSIGLVFLNQYVINKSSLEPKFVDPPVWINNALKEKLYSAAKIEAGDFRARESLAQEVQESVAEHFAWLEDVTVQTNDKELLIDGTWRKPLVLVEMNRRRLYVDDGLVVLDFVKLDSLPIVRVTGLSNQSAPRAGNIWKKEDLAAAIEIIKRFDEMDSLVCPQRPLLYEIANIDVSNFLGRQNSSAHHILLFAKDGTKIIWGAQYGDWAEHLEVPDDQKIGRLYNFYTQHETLGGVARYINLCDPQQYVPQPTDG
jgi:hypothetical protein